MDEYTEDRETPEEEEEMSKFKRLITEVAIEGAKALIERIWSKLSGKSRRLS